MGSGGSTSKSNPAEVRQRSMELRNRQETTTHDEDETELKTLFSTTQSDSNTMLHSNEETDLKKLVSTRQGQSGEGWRLSGVRTVRGGDSVMGTTPIDAGLSDSNSSDYPKVSEYTTSSSDLIPECVMEKPTRQKLSKATYINPETLQRECNKISEGPRANKIHVFPRSSFYDEMDTDMLIEKLRKYGEPRQHVHDVRQCILTGVIPKLEHSRSISELSRFLTSNDEIVCRRVQESLMNFLLTCEDDQDISMILRVEKNIWTKLRPKQDHVFDLGLLELLVWSYLLCHINVSNEFEMKIKETSESRRKDIQEFVKETQSTASSDVFKAMLAFHEDFPKRFAKRGDLPLGSDVLNTCDRRGDGVNKLVKGAKFCDKFTHLYSLLKQIMASEHDCENILAYLGHIFPSLIGNGSCGKTQTLAMLLVKGCMYLLQNVFKEAEVQIGPVKDNTKRQLASLIERCIANLTKKNCLSSWLSSLMITKYRMPREERLQYIISEVSPLIFHRCRSVRDVVHSFVSKFKPDSMLKVFIEEIRRRLSNCGLKISSKAEETNSFFQTLNGSFGNTKVIIHAHTPCYDKLHNVHAEQQVSPDQTLERDNHINNLDMLRKLPSHPNIVELFAYQVKPYPWYYIVEDCQQMTLLKFVLQRRESHRWISDFKLCDFLIDIVHGLSALHEENIVLRDLALQNFFLQGDVVKIGDLSRARVYKTENGKPVKDLHPGDIPTRWTSPEALMEGSFTPWSDIWGMGLAIYALFTHGCDPYTEYYNDTTEDVMRKVVFEELHPFHWSCIPDDLYSVLKQCMRKDPHSRMQLARLDEALLTCRRDKIRNESQGGKNGKTTTFDEIHARDKFYPIIDDRQMKRHHLPERGLPPFIHRFRKEKSENFENSSRREWYFTAPIVQRHDLHAQNDVIVTQSGGEVTVKELMTQSFVTKRLPYIKAANIDALRAKSSSLENNGSNHCMQVRTYDPGNTLLNAALTRSLDHPEASTLTLYLIRCLRVAEFVRDLHNKDLIHRDLRAKNFLVDQYTEKVFACRTNSIIPVPESEIVQDRVFKEISRWLPPEALFTGIYSKPGDVYMLAMMIYEVIQAYERNNIRMDILCVPYCMVPDKKLAAIKQKGDFLPRPESCPVWLYEFLVRCWNPDRCERPDIETLVCLLRSRLREEMKEQGTRQRLFTFSAPSQTVEGQRMGTQTGGSNSRQGRSMFHKIKAKFTKRRPVPVIKTVSPDRGGTMRSERTYASVNESFVFDEPAEQNVRQTSPPSVHGNNLLSCDERLLSRFNGGVPRMANTNDNVAYRPNPGRQRGRKKRKPSSSIANRHSSSTEGSLKVRWNNRKGKRRSRPRGEILSPSILTSPDINSNERPPTEQLKPSPCLPSGLIRSGQVFNSERPRQIVTHGHVPQNGNSEDGNFRNGRKGRSVSFFTPDRPASATSEGSDTMGVKTCKSQRIPNKQGYPGNSGIDTNRDRVWETGEPTGIGASTTASTIHDHIQGREPAFDNPPAINARRLVDMPANSSLPDSVVANTTVTSNESARATHDGRQRILVLNPANGTDEQPVFDVNSTEQIANQHRAIIANSQRHEEHFGGSRSLSSAVHRTLARTTSEGTAAVLNSTGHPPGEIVTHVHTHESEGQFNNVVSRVIGLTSTGRQSEGKPNINNHGRSNNGTIGRSVSLITERGKMFLAGTMATADGAFKKCSSFKRLVSQPITESRHATEGSSEFDTLRPGELTRGHSEGAALSLASVNGAYNQSNEAHLHDHTKLDLGTSRNGTRGFMTSPTTDPLVKTNNGRTAGIRCTVVNYSSDGESPD